MSLTLVELDYPVGERFWFPFTYEDAGLGFNDRWWYNDPVYPDSKSIFLRVLENGDEVARVKLDNEVGIDHYADVPPLGATALEIQFIEVHNHHRGRGIGHAVIDLLHNRYPDRRLVAFSERADGFWSSLGWRRHLHADPEEAPYFRPLFIQPQANALLPSRRPAGPNCFVMSLAGRYCLRRVRADLKMRAEPPRFPCTPAVLPQARLPLRPTAKVVVVEESARFNL